MPSGTNGLDGYLTPGFAYGLEGSSSGCELILPMEDVTKTVTGQGHVSGSFVVGAQGGGDSAFDTNPFVVFREFQHCD